MGGAAGTAPPLSPKPFALENPAARLRNSGVGARIGERLTHVLARKRVVGQMSALMPRFRFHLCERGTLCTDEEGRELPDLAAVQAQAMREARELISADVLGGQLWLHSSIEVTDEAGERVHSLTFRDAVALIDA